MPKILLLGGSIRLNYQPEVERLLKGRAEIIAPAENCQYSLYTLSSLDRWISGLRIADGVDLVHWNNGMHDVGHNSRRCPHQIPLSMYTENLCLILPRLRFISNKVIWATTTPIRGQRVDNTTGWYWEDWEINIYNEEATAAMQSAGVPVHDLHKLISDHDEYLAPDGIHLSDVGKKACGQSVVDFCMTQLGGK